MNKFFYILAVLFITLSANGQASLEIIDECPDCTTLGVSKDGKKQYGYIDANFTRRAFIKTEENGIVILPNLPNVASIGCTPKTISDDGTLIAGICSYTYVIGLPYGGTKPVYWDSGGEIHELETPYEIIYPPSFSSPDYLQIYNCTNSKIAGSFGKPCSQYFSGYVGSAVVWKPGIQYLQDPSNALCGATYTARSIAKNIDVVVGTIYNYPIGEIPVRWSFGNIEYLSTNQGVPNDVSDDGKIVVGEESGYAFRWNLETGLQYLTKKESTIPEPSNALSITGDGTYIVGEGYFPGGFIWSKASGVLNLSELLISKYGLGVQLSGKTLSPKKVQRENNEVIISGDIYSLANGYKKFIVKFSPDTDGDGLTDKEEDVNNNGVFDSGDLADFKNPDTDEDGLLDGWEVKGLLDEDGNMVLPLHLPPYNANPLHKDIFLEIDWMLAAFAPSQNALNQVINVFASAPVSNPDEVTGINLHIDIGQFNEPKGGGQLVPYADVCYLSQANFVCDGSLSVGSFYALKPLFFNNKRDGIFHYAISVNSSECDKNGDPGTVNGIGEVWGDDLIISLGFYGFNNDKHVAATLLHELGHNLALRHGGSLEDTIKFKPNYFSVMNYSFAFSGIPPNWTLDYSSQQMNPLIEDALDENEGIGFVSKTKYFVAFPPPLIRKCLVTEGLQKAIDWNADGVINSDIVSANINNCPGFTPTNQILHGHNDWEKIKLNFRDSPGFGDNALVELPNETFTPAVARAVNGDPVANAGSDLFISLCSIQPVTLNGLLSKDPDGEIMSYEWTGPFPEGAGVVYGGTPSVSLPFGTSLVRLIVEDDLEFSVPDDIYVTILFPDIDNDGTCDEIDNCISPTLTIAQILDASCTSAPNGSAQISVTGGTAPYTFLWCDGGTTNPNSNLTAGSHSVTVTDANGCSATIFVTVDVQPDMIASTTVTDASCSSAANGSILATVSGGASPYTFIWSNGNTSNPLVNVPPGTYTATVTDANGCSTTSSATVANQPIPLIAVLNVLADATCNQANGSITLSIAYGSLPYTVLWSNGSTSDPLTNVPPGTYTATVTDAAGCSATASATVSNQPSSLAVSLTATDASCNLANGSITSNITNGAAPYSLLWSNGATSNPLTNVPPGTYLVTATDASGCSATASATVANQPSTLGLTLTVTDASCNITNGAIISTVTGGTAPYAFVWSDGSTSSALSGLAAGPYGVTATDANGCSTSGTATVANQPSLVALVSVVTPIECPGGMGQVLVAASGGTSPFIGIGLQNAGEGTTNFAVTDANGCNAIAQITLTANDAQFPTISCPANASGSTDLGACFSTNISLGSATPFDNCSVSVSNNAPSNFPLGSTPVTWTATDGSGNSTICTQLVLVTAPSETCNGLDDDCDGQTDEGMTTTFYRDSDGDSFGNAAVTTQACSAPSGFVSDNTDCNDANAAINPGATEIACNGIDENCDGDPDHDAGNGLNFDGGNDLVSVPDNSLLDFPPGSSLTVEAWVKRTSTASVQHIIGKRAGSAINYQLMQDGSQLAFGGMTGNGVGAGVLLPLNQWAHVAGVYNGSVYKIYLNGVLLGTSSAQPLGSPNNADLTLGESGATGLPFGGSLDEVRIWNQARTQAEIYASINCELIGNEAGLVAYYNFNQGVAGGNNAGVATVLDQSSNGLNGTLQNFSLNGSSSNWVASGAIVNGSCATAPQETCNGLDDDCDGLVDEGCSAPPIVNAGTCQVVYHGYAPQACTTLTVVASGATPPYSYLWSNGATTSSITVCPTISTTYSVSVTDVNGLIATDPVTVEVVDVRCGNNLDKVNICHIPPGNQGNPNTLCVSENSVPAHLAHGDYLGSCGTNPCSNLGGYNLLYFGANSTAEMEVQLEWINKSQTANDYFVVEKSADRVHFDSLLRRDGSGPSDEVEIYRDMDLNPFEGYNYYRLKVVYKGGGFEYSNIEVVLFNPDSDFTIFPNPTSDEVRLYLDRFMGKEDVDVIIVNTLGEVLYKEHLVVVKDKILPIRLDRNRFTDGLYSVSVVYLGRAHSKRLVVARN